MKCKPAFPAACIIMSLIFISCNNAGNPGLFTSLPSTESGITFTNTIDETTLPGDALNEFAYMGGGVGVLDVNNDGLKDLFFGGNQVSSKLYLNKGNNHFEDITQAAGVATTDWITGVSVADINADGYDDIYLCTYGKTLGTRSANPLFINRHNNTFTQEAATYGLADTSYSTQAVFFDYDKDGDLDMYLSNYLLNASYSANNLYPKDLSGRSKANDRLYKNTGVQNGHPYFEDVTLQAGIKDDGYGLGVSVCDFNMDGYPDVLVCGDFISNDNLWLNNKNGTFTDVLNVATRHQSYSSMGCDAADINNDGLFDFASVDMMPEDNERKKQTFSFMNYERYQQERRLGYAPEFMRNMLQLNNGNTFRGDTALPFFSEIGQLAGISETDWSWSILFADFNNDGFKDAHITNGIGRDFINADFISFSQTTAAGSGADRQKILRDKLVALQHVELPNYLYINNGDYTFNDRTDSSGLSENAMSNGAVYADLDNDNDLDLVVNNINKPAFVLINNANSGKAPKAGHSIAFELKGDSLNTRGFGAKVFVYANGTAQVQEQYPVRGYLSTVDTRMLFGTGTNTTLDSVVVVWANNHTQVLRNCVADTLYTLRQQDAVAQWQPASLRQQATLFTEMTAAVNAGYRHADVEYNDYAEQRLLPQKYSQLGPLMAEGDVNNDGLTDFYTGAAFNTQGKLFIQQRNGSFTGKDFVPASKFTEDAAAAFFDADKDGDQDLLITYGDMRYADTSMFYHPELYLNDGKGNFSLSANAIAPAVKTIAGCVAVADYDADGDIDVFIGGRVSKQFPSSPDSYLLQNNHGVFTDVTGTVCSGLSKAGMVTGAQWADIDNDQHPDLVIAGEYMPVRFFKNNGKQLTEITATTGLQQMNGLWRSLLATDLDNDGDTDFIAGNLGLNCNYHTSATYPMMLYAKDIDNNGSIDPVMFYYIKDGGKRTLYPSVSKDQLAGQVPAIKKQFLLNKDFAKATAAKIYGNDNKTLVLTCDETQTCWIENTGNGKFIKHVLPKEAQFAPVNALLCADIDNDGIKDILLAGNEYQADVMTGRYDASYGCFLKGAPGGQFKAVPPVVSGFKTSGDVKDLKLVTTAKGRLVIAAVNDDYLEVFGIKTQ